MSHVTKIAYSCEMDACTLPPLRLDFKKVDGTYCMDVKYRKLLSRVRNKATRRLEGVGVYTTALTALWYSLSKEEMIWMNSFLNLENT